MRYLLDELMAYEEGFSDILLKGRAYQRHENFMGEGDAAASVTKQDLETFYAKIEDLVLRTPHKGTPEMHESYPANGKLSFYGEVETSNSCLHSHY